MGEVLKMVTEETSTWSVLEFKSWLESKKESLSPPVLWGEKRG